MPDDYGFAVISTSPWMCRAGFWSSSQKYYINGNSYGQDVVASASTDTILSVRCVENHGPEWQRQLSFVDNRDGKSYRQVNVGGKTWMAENLNYEYKVDGSTYGNWCYENSADSCAKYGRLYTWAAAMDSAVTGCGDGDTCRISGNVRGICPAGWHLPSLTELGVLEGSQYGVGGSLLRAESGWNDYNGYEGLNGANSNGLDLFGFALLPAGYRCAVEDAWTNQQRCKDKEFRDAGYFGYLWSSNDYGKTGAYSLFTSGTHNWTTSWNPGKILGFPVRCVKD